MSVLRDRIARAARVLVEPLLARKICPTCHQRKLEPDPDLEPTVQVGYVAAYRCRSCGGQWRSLDAGPMIPRTAWDAGVRDDASTPPSLARSIARAARRIRERATRVVEPLLARKVCPQCRARSLEPDPEQVTEQQGASVVAAYRCRTCSGQWRSLDGEALIARVDWEDGARGGELPTATVHDSVPKARPRGQR
jgi:RNase P subunit RPR2